MKRIILALCVFGLSGCAGMGGFFDTKGGPPSAPPYRLTDAEIAAGTATTPGLITAKQYTDNLAAGSGINNVVEDLTPQLGGDLDQNGHNINITDTGSIITATTLDAALQEHRTAINLNTAKETNVSTNLSEGTATETTVDVNSSDGTNATLASASTSRAGLLTKAKFDEIVANSLKVSFTWDYDYGDLINTPTIPTVSDVAYDATSWDTNTDAPTKNAVRDKIESLAGGHDALTIDASLSSVFGLGAGQVLTLSAWPTFNQNTSGTAASITGDLDPDQLSGDTVDDNLIDQNIVAGLTTAGSASPGFTAYDSDSPGADKTAGFIGWQYVDGADGSENSDWLLQIMQAGSLTTVLYFDESDDQFETTKVINSSGGFTGNLTGNASGSAGSVAVGNITGAGTGVLTALAVNVGSAGAPVLYNGALGTPSGGTLTSCTGLPTSGLTDGDKGDISNSSGTLTIDTDAVDYANTVGSFKSLTPVNDSAANFAANFTGANLYGGTFLCSTTGTIQLPAVAAGMNFTIITVGAIAISADTNASDLMMLDGVALDDGDKATNTSTAGDIIVFQYMDATGWVATSNGWTDGGA